MTRVGPAGAFVRTAAGPAPLTEREMEVLTAYARCGVVKVAAADLGITYSTAKGHIYRAYRKLGVDNAPDAFRLLGWLQAPV